MLKLLQWDNLERIAKHPEQVNLKELLGICNQIFMVQFVVGIWSFVPGAYRHSIGLDTLGNVAIPMLGIYYTRDEDPENYGMLRIAAGYWVFGIVFGVIKNLPRFFEFFRLVGLILKTCVATVQWLAIARVWRMLQDRLISNKSFFLNVVILNKREVVSAGACQKTGWGEKVGTRHLGKLAGKLANRVVNDEKFSGNLAQKIASNIPEKMSLNGIAASAEPQFTRGNLVVVKVTIDNVDTQKLVAKKLGTEKAGKISRVLSFLPRRVQSELQRNMLTKVAYGLMLRLPEDMAAELKTMGGVEVVVEVKSPAEEAEFLFHLLEELEQDASASNPASSESLT